MSSGFDTDPYASPRFPVEREEVTGAMKSGRLLMVRDETELPICPFTGLPIEASWPVEWHTISWNSPWSYLPFVALVAANAL
ncbi:MAG: hypothetical protein JWO82_2372, partial [Akkermansiaceae bacterium]|nr:hypothetical protein [Akkermansiaceae bacterium]